MKRRYNKSTFLSCSLGLMCSILMTGCGERTLPGDQVSIGWKVLKEAVCTDHITDSLQEQEDYYFYRCLTESEQSVYREILDTLQSFSKEKELACKDAETVEKIFRYVMDDHPEVFYLVGYDIVTTRTESDRGLSFRPNYTVGRIEAVARNQKIRERADECLAGFDNGLDQYGKAKYIYDYIIDNTDYVAGSPDNQNICSVFLNGESVCSGYARTMQYLLQKAGIEAAILCGRVSDTEDHSWDLVKLDGNYYHVDPTWGDVSYLNQRESDGAALADINYDYFCITTEQLELTHRIDSDIPLPDCTAREDNYYIREGLYFSDVDEAQLKRAFQKATCEDRGSIAILCSDREAYEKMYIHLLDEQKIFDYIHTSDGSITIASNDAAYTFIIWM